MTLGSWIDSCLICDHGWAAEIFDGSSSTSLLRSFARPLWPVITRPSMLVTTLRRTPHLDFLHHTDIRRKRQRPIHRCTLMGIFYCASLGVEWQQTLAARPELTAILWWRIAAITEWVLAECPPGRKRPSLYRIQVISDIKRFVAKVALAIRIGVKVRFLRPTIVYRLKTFGNY